MRADVRWFWFAPFIVMLASSCGGGGGGGNPTPTSTPTPTPTPTYTLGVSVTGLGSSKTLVLSNNGGGNLTVSANGRFTFATPVNQGAAYNVTLVTQPTGQTCTVSNGSGTVDGANVTHVVVTCVVATYTVSGTLAGLGSNKTLVLSNNGGGNLTVSANGSFTFATPVNQGAAYNVTLFTQPIGQTCTVSNGSGTVDGASVTHVVVTCVAATYTVSGTLAGLGSNKTLVLSNNGGDNLTVSANGHFTFATPVNQGAAYNVTLFTQPIGQTCTISIGSGTVDGANVAHVVVTCVVATYTVSGTLAELGSSKTLVLSNNGGGNLTVSANGSFTFATPVNQGAAYNVTIFTQPIGQTCAVSNGSGTVGGANVSNVVVTCVVSTFTVSGTITAASGSVADSDVNDSNAAYVANDSLSTAQSIGNPATVGGYVNQAGFGAPGPSRVLGDANDLFRVTLAAGQVLTLTIGDISTGDLDLFLIDAAGITVASSVGTGVTETITVTTAGSYFINVYAFTASASNYILTIGQSINTASTPPLSVLSEFVPGELIARFEPTAAIKRGAQALVARIEAMGMEMTASAAAATERPVLIKLDESTLSATSATAGATTAKEALPLGIAGNPALERKWRTLRAIKQLGKQPGVRYAEPNYILQPSATPNDSSYRFQWHYPLINLPQAWDITTGSSAVIVAVIDTGVLLTHPDLQGQLVSGYDFISDPANARDGNGRDPDPNDPGDLGGRNDNGISTFHGTHVAGTIAAATNNGIGVAGVAWNARIMPLRVLGKGGGNSNDINQAILYAAGLSNGSGTLPAQRADIINMSLGGPDFSQAQQEVITQARNQGVIIIAAAGNNAQVDNSIVYPASYNGVVSVGAVDMNKTRAPYSRFNASVDIAAPGGDTSRDLNGDGHLDGVLSTAGDDSGGTVGDDSGRTLDFVYKPFQGTSMAAPHVAGVAALMKAVNPALTPAQFDSLLVSGKLTQDLGTAGRDNEFGYGLVDAHAAVVAAQDIPAPAPAKLVATPNGLNFATQGTNATLSLANGGGGSLSVTSASDNASWLTVGAASDSATGLGTRTVTVNRMGLPEGTYTASITLVSTVNTVTIPVIMQVSTGNAADNAGFHYVLLINSVTGEKEYETQLSANNGVYQFSIPNVVAGSYDVIAGSDFNNDFFICDAGEACGAYPILNSSSPLQVNSGVTGVDFGTGFNTVIRAQSAGVPDGSGLRGYARFSGKRVGR